MCPFQDSRLANERNWPLCQSSMVSPSGFEPLASTFAGSRAIRCAKGTGASVGNRTLVGRLRVVCSTY